MNNPQAETLALASIDSAQARKLAESINRFGFNFDKFDDPLLYPSANVDPSSAALFFFFIVSIDHRTGNNGSVFKGRVNGVELTGSELMYALAMRRFEEDPAFFTAERMSLVSREDIANLLRVKEPKTMDVVGAAERAILLRDCGLKLHRYFQGSVQKMISMSGGYLMRPDGSGFLQLLERFDAYKDPLRKKPFLLVKFLERRRLFSIKDADSLHVPVDNILQRLALRMGIVRITNTELDNKIRNDIHVDSAEEEAIRQVTMRAFDEVSRDASLGASYLDDILWEFGRVHCRVPIPLCDKLPETNSRRPYRIIKSGPIGECPFGQGCKSYMSPAGWSLKEPNYKTTFY